MVIISKNPVAKLHYNEYVWPVDNTQSGDNDKLLVKSDGRQTCI